MSFFAPKKTYQLWPNANASTPPRFAPPKPPRGVYREEQEPEMNVEEHTRENKAPPKPPRGIPRRPPTLPMPLAEKSNVEPKANTFKFAATERRNQLIEEFRAKVDADGLETFNGLQGLDAMIEVVIENSAERVEGKDAKDRALRLLDLWLQESILRLEGATGKELVDEYRDDRKTRYRFDAPENYRVVLTPRTRTTRSRSSSRERNPIRRGSIKRLFRFGSDEDVTPKPTLFGDDDKEESSMIEKPRLFGFAGRFTTTNDDSHLKDEAQLFAAALRALLLEVDVPVLDDVLNVRDCKEEKSVSFVSDLLRRFGFGSESRARHSDDVFAFIGNCAHLRRTRDVVSTWFRRALASAPSLHLERQPLLSDHSQIHDWAKLAIRGVVENCTHITHHARNPLIPAEFAPFLLAVTDQLCTRGVDVRKRDRVLHLIWLMIPTKLRRHLNELLDLLQATQGTDSSFNFRDPFFVDKQSQELGANFWFVVEELRNFIVPSTLAEAKQLSVIQLFLHVRSGRDLDAVPPELHAEMVSKQQTHVAFCRGEQVTNFEEQTRIVGMIDGIVKSTAFTPQRKREMVIQCRRDYPEIMSVHFPTL